MSIDVSFYIHTETSADELLSACHKALQPFQLQEPTLDVSEARVTELKNEILSEGYQLTATTGILFTLNTRGDVAAQMHALLGASLQLIHQYPGDAALIFNGDVAYFIRRNGTLILNNRDGMWTPERRALVQGPFARENLPDL